MCVKNIKFYSWSHLNINLGLLNAIYKMGSPDDIPTRMYMDDPGITWKQGKPDYSTADIKYMAERSKRHKADSVEKLVENLVKTWEMESSHKTHPKDWKTVDQGKFQMSANGGFVGKLKDNIEMGNYNILMKDAPLYNPDMSCEQSHDLFRKAFPAGFPWELLELHSGPPTASFTWRHWAHWEGAFLGEKPTGELLEMYGSCVAKVNETGQITELQIYFDPNQMLAKMLKFDVNKIEGCPYSKI